VCTTLHWSWHSFAARLPTSPRVHHSTPAPHSRTLHIWTAKKRVSPQRRRLHLPARLSSNCRALGEGTSVNHRHSRRASRPAHFIDLSCKPGRTTTMAANGTLSPSSLPPAFTLPAIAKRKHAATNSAVSNGALPSAQGHYTPQMVLEDILAVLKRYAAFDFRTRPFAELNDATPRYEASLRAPFHVGRLA
jgi:hypothetical protein